MARARTTRAQIVCNLRWTGKTRLQQRLSAFAKEAEVVASACPTLQKRITSQIA